MNTTSGIVSLTIATRPGRVGSFGFQRFRWMYKNSRGSGFSDFFFFFTGGLVGLSYPQGVSKIFLPWNIFLDVKDRQDEIGPGGH